MQSKTVKRAAMYFALIICAYLVIGNLLHRVVFPEKKPAIPTYFRPGQEFYSKAEGFRQRVVKQEAGVVLCHLEMEPHAGGPPKHIHTSFDEVVEVENGEASVWLDGEVKTVRPGQQLTIPKGTPHKIYNATGDTVRFKGAIAFPEAFAYNLVQVYGFMDSYPDFGNSLKTIFQMAMFQQAGLDSYAGEGPPVFVQKLVGFVASPLSRLAGLKSYYEEYDLMKDNDGSDGNGHMLSALQCPATHRFYWSQEQFVRGFAACLN